MKIMTGLPEGHGQRNEVDLSRFRAFMEGYLQPDPVTFIKTLLERPRLHNNLSRKVDVAKQLLERQIVSRNPDLILQPAGHSPAIPMPVFPSEIRALLSEYGIELSEVSGGITATSKDGRSLSLAVYQSGSEINAVVKRTNSDFPLYKITLKSAADLSEEWKERQLLDFAVMIAFESHRDCVVD